MRYHKAALVNLETQHNCPEYGQMVTLLALLCPPQLIITNDQGGIRLRLKVTAPVTADIMAFGEAPCSAGRSKRLNVSYIGLLPPAQDGLCDITAQYVARHGAPRPGEKLFIVTRQQKDGWESFDHQTSEIVPEPPAAQPALATGASTLQVYMHKGCTRDAQGINPQSTPDTQETNKQDPPVKTPRYTAAAPDQLGRAVPFISVLSVPSFPFRPPHPASQVTQAPAPRICPKMSQISRQLRPPSPCWGQPTQPSTGNTIRAAVPLASRR